VSALAKVCSCAACEAGVYAYCSRASDEVWRVGPVVSGSPSVVYGETVGGETVSEASRSRGDDRRSGSTSVVMVDRYELDDLLSGEVWQGYETGGMLVGRSDGGRVEVFKRYRADVEELGRRRQMTFDAEYIDERRAMLPHEDLVGIWHTHPTEGTLTLSRADIEAAADVAKALGRASVISLIVRNLEDEVGGYVPQLAAWMVTSQGAHWQLAIEEA